MRAKRIQGLTGTLPPATYADSTKVANFARAAEDFYQNPNNRYFRLDTMSPEQYTSTYSGTNDWGEFMDALVKSVRSQNREAGTGSMDIGQAINTIRAAFGEDITPTDLMRMADNPNQIIPTDLLKGLSNLVFNPKAPDPVFDRRILPESIDTYGYTDPLVGYGYQDLTDIPRYDRIMVTPWRDLNDNEKSLRVQGAMISGNTGGIPDSVMANANNTLAVNTTSLPFGTKKMVSRKKPYTSAKMPSLPPSRIPVEAIEERELAPIRVIKSTGREPQTMYRVDPAVSSGQYPIGEYIYNPDKRRWQTDMWDEDMIRASRELALPRRENWRTIETPPGGFMNGGKIKIKKKC